MKRKKIKNHPGQLSIFEQVKYSGENYNCLNHAMLAAFQDFYIFKKYPAKIVAFGKVYNFRAMRRYWDVYGFEDICVC